jgi:hypothetical protein
VELFIGILVADLLIFILYLIIKLGTINFTRCDFDSCYCGSLGGAICFGNNIFSVANCIFKNNKAGTGYDVYYYSSYAPTSSTFYGCCSTTLPQLNRIYPSAQSYTQYLPDCDLDPRYVSINVGNDVNGCGKNTGSQCKTINFTHDNYINVRPLRLIIDYGNYLTNQINIKEREVELNGTVKNGGTKIYFSSVAQAAVLNITTGTVTGNNLIFVQTRSTSGGSIISLTGNGTLTIRDCIFTQNTTSAEHVNSPIFRINNNATIIIVERCTIKDILADSASAIIGNLGKSADFLNCTWFNCTCINNLTTSEEYGGALTCSLNTLTITYGTFTNCSSNKFGGAIYLRASCKFRIQDIVFEACKAENGGGAIYTLAPGNDSTFRQLVRLKFVDCVSVTQNRGNDIRDVNGKKTLWSFGNAVDLCSNSKHLRFSVENDISGYYEIYIPNCFYNPCTAYTAQNCPPECRNESNQCVPADCTRLHYEETCFEGCAMLNKTDCVNDPCYKKIKSECDAECEWGNPPPISPFMSNMYKKNSFSLANEGEICKAHNCTRLYNQTKCDKEGCTYDINQKCVEDICAVDVAHGVECPLDCDRFPVPNENYLSCVPTDCTRQHNEIDCYEGCLKESDGRCTVNPCIGKSKENCSTDCKWISNGTGGHCDIHECTPLHHEKDCKNGCVKDLDEHCVIDVCYGKKKEDECPKDCTWNTATGNCTYNPCVRLNGDEECYEGCQLDQNGACVTDPCFNKSQNQCPEDCDWNGGKCEWQECTRLHNESECYENCQKDSKGGCFPDPCSEYDGKDPETCPKDCTFIPRNVSNPTSVDKCVFNNCTRLHNETDCNNYTGCQLDGDKACVPDVCYDKNETECKDQLDCVWEDGECKSDSGCVRQHNEEKCYDGCQMNDESECVEDPCSNISSEADCNKTDCFYDNTAKTCNFTDCYRFDKDSECEEGCKEVQSNRIPDNKSCIPDECYEHNKKEECEEDKTRNCIWTISTRTGTLKPICEENPCSQPQDSTANCPDSSSNGKCIRDGNGTCVPDICSGVKKEDLCFIDCVWDSSKPEEPCQSTNCTRLHNEEKCKEEVCVEDRDGTCTEDICYGLNETECIKECNYDKDLEKCVTDNCTRLHNETDCYLGCKLDNNENCVEDECAKHGNKSDCEGDDENGCMWTKPSSRLPEMCIKNPCVLESGNDGCKSKEGCTIDRNNNSNATDDDSCVPDPCYNKTQRDCPADCTWSENEGCLVNNCTRLHYEKDCYEGCIESLKNSCIPNICYNKSEDECRKTDCSWKNGSCEWNDCVRYDGPDGKCGVGCKKTPDNRCVPDICANISEDECDKTDCIWNGRKCEWNQCVREDVEDECENKEGCILDSDEKCVINVCDENATKEECFGDCWNVEEEKCKNGECVRLHGEEECPEGCEFDPTRPGSCIPDPCLNISNEADCEKKKLLLEF